MANLDNLMSFSSDEEDNASVNSELSWQTILSSEFNVGPSCRPGTESTRSLSPNFFISDSHQSSSGRSDSKYSIRHAQGAKMEVLSPQSSFPLDGDHLRWIGFSSDIETGPGTNLFDEEFKLRTSHSSDELSPPRSPVKKRNNIPRFPQGGFANYHNAFRPPLEFNSDRATNYIGSEVQPIAETLKNTGRSPSYTSSLFVTLNNQHSDLGIQSSNPVFCKQCIIWFQQ